MLSFLQIQLRLEKTSSEKKKTPLLFQQVFSVIKVFTSLSIEYDLLQVDLDGPKVTFLAG